MSKYIIVANSKNCTQLLFIFKILEIIFRIINYNLKMDRNIFKWRKYLENKLKKDPNDIEQKVFSLN